MAGEHLRVRDCYVGQRVFWCMWVDQEDADRKRSVGSPVTGWYAYRRGLSPEIWAGVVERLTKSGCIMLRHFGRAGLVYSCEVDAVHDAYRIFCSLHLSDRYSHLVRPGLEEASRVLRLLCDLEVGCHQAQAAMNLSEVNYGR